MRKNYNKLVRDNIPEIIKSNGDDCIIHIASDDEYWQKLKEKLQEEVSEFLEENNIKELADILEVYYAIIDYMKISIDDVEIERQKKSDSRGSFKKKIILEETISKK